MILTVVILLGAEVDHKKHKAEHKGRKYSLRFRTLLSVGFAPFVFCFVLFVGPLASVLRGHKVMAQIIAIIPARMGSSRFPGKPLARILGRPMIEHVFRRAAMCGLLDAVYIATCDEEIRRVAEGFGAPVLMTSSAHERASDRVAEAAASLESDIVVMMQGDEPMITPGMIVSAVAPMIP